MGICTPCVISASTLFCVVTRGVDSRRPLPADSRAVSAMSRFNAPLIDPSAMPTALLGAAAGRVVVPVTPALLGNASPVDPPSAGSTRPLKPHCTPRLCA